MDFENIEDEKYFESLLEAFGGLENNRELFDFRDPDQKRKEFNAKRDSVFEKLKESYGNSCQLRCHEDCEEIGDQVDHLIPLSSNVLNKQLRALKGKEGKKVPAQSFGSNHVSNFVLACKRCNAFKKHRFPTVATLIYIKSIRSGE